MVTQERNCWEYRLLYVWPILLLQSSWERAQWVSKKCFTLLYSTYLIFWIKKWFSIWFYSFSVRWSALPREQHSTLLQGHRSFWVSDHHQTPLTWLFWLKGTSPWLVSKQNTTFLLKSIVKSIFCIEVILKTLKVSYWILEVHCLPLHL